MGLIYCDRVGCENIMADHEVKGIYAQLRICNDCLTELENFRDGWTSAIIPAQVPHLIRDFMMEPKSPPSTGPTKEVLEEFEKLVTRDVRWPKGLD